MKIVILCTYPVEVPRHGGQIRVSNIARVYGDAGYEVQVAGVLGSTQYDVEKGFIPFPSGEISEKLPNSFLIEDYGIGLVMGTDSSLFDQLCEEIAFVPDVIHIEQPWLFRFALKYREIHAPMAKLIYGSQNIEWKLKFDILRGYVAELDARRSSELVKVMELEAISKSDAVICVSESDAEWVEALTSNPCVVAANGVAAWERDTAGETEARIVTKEHPYALFCASAHPPNMKGFFDLLGGGFGSLKPDERLVIAGSVGAPISMDSRLAKSANLKERSIITGEISQSCLEGLLSKAACIVLPITQGGGTNLKTAEAIWAGKYIVATTTAMRGFERFMDSPGVLIADEPSGFKMQLRHAMSAPSIKLDSQEIEKRRSVLWEECLKPAVTLVRKVSGITN